MEGPGPLPPGDEARNLKIEKVENDLMGFLKNDSVPSFSNYKGYAYVFKFSEFNSARGHATEQLRAASLLTKQSGLTKTNEWRYPTATRRLCGQRSPGQQLRKDLKATERKTTRAQVELLCKYMLFKKGKFTPGKMV